MTPAQRAQMKKALQGLEAQLLGKGSRKVDPNRTDEARGGRRRGRAAAQRDAPDHRLQPEPESDAAMLARGGQARWGSCARTRTPSASARSAATRFRWAA